MDMSDVTRAVAAAASVAASLDLPANDAIVLHNSNKLALRLTFYAGQMTLYDSPGFKR